MKITGGFLKNRLIRAPKGSHIRPTSARVRESFYNIYRTRVTSANFLDLFAGSGVMGIEALSRGAQSATFIENDPSALRTIRNNLRELNILPLATIYAGSVLTWLKKLRGQTFNLIYIDPPYHTNLHVHTLKLIDQSHLLAEGGMLFVEGRRMQELNFNQLNIRDKRKIGDTFLYQFDKRGR